MAVLLGSELSIDDQVAVEFTPPFSRQAITLRAFVRDRSGSSYGIEFITENDTDYSNVAQLESALKALGSLGKQGATEACA